MAPVRFEERCFLVVGRFERLPRARIERELAARGAKLHRRLNRNTDYAVVTHAAASLLGSPTLDAVLALDPARVLGEDDFLRALGLMPALVGKDIEEARFLALSGL